MKIKKLTASVLSLALIASVSGCANLDKDDDAVLAAAEDYAEAISKVKVSDITDLLVDGDDAEDAIEDLISGALAQEVPEGFGDMTDAIADTIEYEVDEGSVESSKKNAEASVDVFFKNASSAGGTDTFKIKKIELELDNSDFYNTSVLTNSEGKGMEQIPFGRYRITDLRTSTMSTASILMLLIIYSRLLSQVISTISSGTILPTVSIRMSPRSNLIS